MSTLTDWVSCNAAQTSLITAWKYDNKKGQSEQAVFTRFLLSPENDSKFFQTNIVMRPGGYRTVDVIYDHIFLESSVTANARIACSASGDVGETSKSYFIDPSIGARKEFAINLIDLQTRCENPALEIGRKLLDAMNACVEYMETDLTDDALTNAGNFASDVINGGPVGTTTEVQVTTKLSGGAIDTNAMEVVGLETTQNGFMTKPFIFGGSTWWKYAKALNAACCSATLGLDAGAYALDNGLRIAYTEKIQTNADADTGLAVIPGTIQLVTFNEFGGTNAVNPLVYDTGKEIWGTLVHPELGLEFAYSGAIVCTDQNTKVFQGQVAIAYKALYLPEDMYPTGYKLEGVNGINKYVVNNP